MLEHRLFGSTPIWRRRHRLRPMVLAVFSYRYDEELVPDLLANIEPVVDGWVAFDDRRADELFSSEPQRRRLLIERARELGATWVLAVDPDERIERDCATRIRSLSGERERVVWEFNLREMFTASSYRVDGLWGQKNRGRLFPVFDGPLCAEQPLHGAWCVAPAGYSVLAAGLNLYHLKMLSYDSRLARRDLYQYLDPGNLYQEAGYDYLIDENGAAFERIQPGRDFFPAHRDTGQVYMADIARTTPTATSELPCVTRGPEAGPASVSQLGQLRISIGERVRRDSRLAVIVIGLSAPKSLFDAVRSLVLQDTLSEIIVVNSGGGDVSGVLGEYLPHVVLVELAEPVFVGAARNKGIQVSCAPFVAFLAGDCTAAPGWVAERMLAHMQGECAVGSFVDNDKSRNPFAWAAHLMTYGHRMVGVTDDEAHSAAYGASYDRTLFDKYGYFSEAMAVGEDSEFHSRFRRSDSVGLNNSVRTIHCNPGGPVSFLKDQFRRGQRGRYLADFFRTDFTIAYIALVTIRRVLRSLRLSLTLLRGTERLAAVAAWPLLPIGAIFYCWGMITSHMKASVAEHFYRKAARLALLGRLEAAVGLLRRAVGLRPVTARYHLMLGALLKQSGKYDSSARELYTSWDIERRSIVELYCDSDRTNAAAAKAEPIADPICLQVIVFSDSSDVQLAEFLTAVNVQGSPSGKLETFVVTARDSRGISKSMHQVRQTYGDFATFVSPEVLLKALSDENSRLDTPSRSFVVVSSSSCIPPPDWLAVLRAYIVTYPEIGVFHGNCLPQDVERAGFIERMNYDLGLFPRTLDCGGIIRFAHAGNWACDRSLLIGPGGLTHDMKTLGFWTLTQRAMKAGASGMYASEWQSRFRIDSSLVKLLRRFYHDGYYGAKHVMMTKDRKLASGFSSVGGFDGLTKAAWKFALDRFKSWRFADRSFLLHAPAFLLLLSVGLAHQAGWLAGLKRFGRSQPGS
jgi:glycosyltransferase involved in cell wall biosynthesis